MQVYLNGAFMEQERAMVSVADRGFIFGDGVYEVFRVVDGDVFMEQEHLSRLNASLNGLRIELSEARLCGIPAIGRELLERNGHATGEATVYVQVTRGAALPRTHAFPHPAVSPTLFLSSDRFTPHAQWHAEGVAAITLPDLRWSRCHLKTINLLPNTLAKQQAVEAGVNSAILIRDGVITESPSANVFGVKGHRLYTFPASHYILSGITRGAVLRIAGEHGIDVLQEPVRWEDRLDLDELFFTGTTTDIQPVVRVDGQPIGFGEPGPVVRTLQTGYQKLLYGARG